jgi:hypothetical protein
MPIGKGIAFWGSPINSGQKAIAEWKKGNACTSGRFFSGFQHIGKYFLMLFSLVEGKRDNLLGSLNQFRSRSDHLLDAQLFPVIRLNGKAIAFRVVLSISVTSPFGQKAIAFREAQSIPVICPIEKAIAYPACTKLSRESRWRCW